METSNCNKHGSVVPVGRCGQCEAEALAAAREDGYQAGLLEGERARTLSPCSDCGDGYPARYLRQGRCLDCAIRHAYRAGQEAMRERATEVAGERWGYWELLTFHSSANPEAVNRAADYVLRVARDRIRALPVEDQP